MQKKSTDQIRQLWLTYFKQKNHFLLEPCSLIPVNDNSLLWINAGVTTLKSYFTGQIKPPCARLANAQKVLRTSDLTNVGKTTRHHTLFEMLGNFSIGAYFKKEALLMAWDFLTNPQWLGLEAKKLYVTIFKEDELAKKIWLNDVKLASDHLILGTRNTNFWEIGAGPCGPNTEIFYDRGEYFDPTHTGIALLNNDQENDRYLEIWNIVFSEFDHDGKGNYKELPTKNIDTGAGLERIACVMQAVDTNYETDNFIPIIQTIEKLTPYHYLFKSYNSQDQAQKKINQAFNVITDHIRALVMAIADGEVPSNKERGYVLRRILRRLILFGKKLKINDPFLCKLITPVVNTLGTYYPHLIKQKKVIANILTQEEKQFNFLLQQQNVIFNKLITKSKNQIITSERAFQLYDTYGFPIEMILEKAKAHGFAIDEKALNTLIEKHRFQSKAHPKFTAGFIKNNRAFKNYLVPTNNLYEQEDIIKKCKVEYLVLKEQPVQTVTDQTCALVLNKTPFYAEKGGQAGDQGTIIGDHFTGHVLDVQQTNPGQYTHYVKIKGTVKIKDLVTAHVDEALRYYTRKNHSGTHFLHSAIRAVLGKHVQQVGSYNNKQFLRIDVNYPGKITQAQLQKIEQLTNQEIQKKLPVEIYYTSYDEAIHKYHALAFFAEKYLKEVRVVKFGTFSSELCGGTHCYNGADIEELFIYNVEKKGRIIYRFYALTSKLHIKQFLEARTQEAKTLATQKYELLSKKLQEQLKLAYLDLLKKEPNRSNWKEFKLTINEFNQKLTKAKKTTKNLIQANAVQTQQTYTNDHAVVNYYHGLTPQTLRPLLRKSETNHPDKLNILISKLKNKYFFSIGITQAKQLQANTIFEAFFKKTMALQPKGGGNQHFIQGVFESDCFEIADFWTKLQSYLSKIL